MYKEVKGEGGRKRKKVKVMNRGVCVCRMMAGKGNQGDRKCIYIHVGHMWQMLFPLLCLDRVMICAFQHLLENYDTRQLYVLPFYVTPLVVWPHDKFVNSIWMVSVAFQSLNEKELARLELFTRHTHSVVWKIKGFVVREGVRNIERMERCVARGPKTKAFMKRDIIVALALCNTIWKEETEGRKGSEESEKKRKSWSLTHARTCFHSLFIMLFVK